MIAYQSASISIFYRKISTVREMRVWGCACACAALLVLLLVRLAVAAASWMPMLSKKSILNPKFVGVRQNKLSSQNPGRLHPKLCNLDLNWIFALFGWPGLGQLAEGAHQLPAGPACFSSFSVKIRKGRYTLPPAGPACIFFFKRKFHGFEKKIHRFWKETVKLKKSLWIFFFIIIFLSFLFYFVSFLCIYTKFIAYIKEIFTVIS